VTLLCAVKQRIDQIEIILDSTKSTFFWQIETMSIGSEKGGERWARRIEALFGTPLREKTTKKKPWSDIKPNKVDDDDDDDEVVVLEGNEGTDDDRQDPDCSTASGRGEEDYLPQCFLLHLLCNAHQSVSQTATPRNAVPVAGGGERRTVSTRDELFWVNRIVTNSRRPSWFRPVNEQYNPNDAVALECTKELQEMLSYVRNQNRVLEDAAQQLRVSRALSASLPQQR
jgi:hypothetical protein